jgi:D-alanyl-D-alanine carboxypeptidase (penicillin-binding protein 5/6)
MKKKLLVVVASILLCIAAIPSRAAAEPYVSARNAVLMDMDSGRVIASKSEHERRPIASITKIMTALLAIESGRMSEKVKVSDRALQVEGSSLYLEKGQSLTLEELVYGLMLRSGNDAALAISEFVSGSTPEFVAMMNKKAKQIGMNNTVFMNPHGLDDPRHQSTAYDMALLTAKAMDSPEYRKIVGTASYKTESSPVRVWENKHRLVREGGMVTGGKTGYTKKTGRTLVTTAKQNGLHLVAVTLGAPDDWRDHQALFDDGFAAFKRVTVVEKKQFTVPGEHNFFYAKTTVRFPLTEEEKKTAYVRIVLEQKKKDGRAELWIGEEKQLEVPIFRSESHQDASLWAKVKEAIR